MKIEQSTALIRDLAQKAQNPVAMISFGKDSMVMASLIRDALPHGLNGTHFPRPHAFPIPVLHYRDPWFPFKYDFANWIIKAWDMEVYDYPPGDVGVKVNQERIELVARYQFGSKGIDLPKNVESPKRYPRRDYICGLNDWLGRIQIPLGPYPWDVAFIGHKSSDIDLFEGHMPLKHDSIYIAGVTLVFPLRHWSDEDVWDYTEKNHIPYQGTRYKDRKDLDETWYNPDWTHACTACIDPREEREEVFCPKLKCNVPNRGKEVRQLRYIPEYIG